MAGIGKMQNFHRYYERARKDLLNDTLLDLIGLTIGEIIAFIYLRNTRI